MDGSLDYGWTSQLEHPVPLPPPLEQLHSVAANWKATLARMPGDRGRQIAWRALHGLLGTEFYDARWSPAYHRLTTLSRQFTPLLALASVAVLLAASSAGPARNAKILGLGMVAFLIVQGLALGALPRFALPFLPALFACAIVALRGLDSGARRWAASLVLMLLIGVVAWHRQVLDWEWGMIEAAGVRIEQRIPRGALPSRGPASLHLRISAPLLPSRAELALLGPDGHTLYDSRQDSERGRPYMTVALPDSILEANRTQPVSLTLVSSGQYDANHYFLFPVIPRPWAAPARRNSNPQLSPGSGIRGGALDWWAHPGSH